MPTFVSPVLKWPAAGKAPAGGKVDFAFDPATCPAEDPLAHAFDVAIVLGATQMRVFSYLRYPGYKPADLAAPIDRLLDLAARFDVTLEIENEPVCNIGSVAELADFFAATDRRAVGAPAAGRWSISATAGRWRSRRATTRSRHSAPLVDLIHLKDRDFDARRTVPLGDGDVPWAERAEAPAGRRARRPKWWPAWKPTARRTAAMPQRRSVAALRRIAGEIGVEIV